MADTWDSRRLLDEVRHLAVRGLPREDFTDELGARLRRAFAIDAACWHGLDPENLLLTTANPVELLQTGVLTAETEPLAAATVLSSEYERSDFNSFASLARRRVPVGILSQATRGRPERSARYREYLATVGTPYEMRAAFVARGRAWGCVVLHRAESSGDFTTSEARLLARLSRTIAEGMRASVRVDAATRNEDDAGPGMVVVGADNDLELVTPAAQRLLETLRRESPATAESVPVPLLTLARLARSAGRVGAVPPPDALAMEVPTSAGWLSLHASAAEAGSHGRVAVVVQHASTDSATHLQLEAHGLTGREQEVAVLAVKGLSTAEIARRLVLSPWTVQDHLKAVFEKTLTHSRAELRARIFYDQYLPAIVQGRPLDARGAPSAPAADS